MLILGQDGTILEANEKAQETLGFDPMGRSIEGAIGRKAPMGTPWRSI